jgi:hypothetical protein
MPLNHQGLGKTLGMIALILACQELTVEDSDSEAEDPTKR